jgi:predicted nucleic acid-binding protein
VPVPDLIIAFCGLRAGAAVVTTDLHFRLVPDLTVLAEIEAV